MSSDIKLDGDWVIAEGNWTRLRTLDLMLDAPGRRSNDAGWRRALVHDSHDGLTINYNADYPGGVTIKGDVDVDSLEGKNLTCQLLKTNIMETGSARLGQYTLGYTSLNGVHIGDNTTNTYLPARHVRVEHDLTVDGDANFTEDVKVHDLLVSPVITPHNETDPAYQPFRLFDRLKAMQRKIDDLENRIARLENR